MATIACAAKYEEAEERVPAIPRLCEYTNCMYRAEQIHHTEVLVLQRLDWNLSILTPPHVLGYFFRKVACHCGCRVSCSWRRARVRRVYSSFARVPPALELHTCLARSCH